MEDQKIVMSKVFEKAKMKAIERAFTGYWTDLLYKEPEQVLMDFDSPCKDDVCKYIVKCTGKKWKYFMVTINFKPGVCKGKILLKMEKCVKKKWLWKYIYCIEWRDWNEDSVHVHMKVTPDPEKKIYDCKREIYNTFKHLVGNKLHVDMRYSNRDDCFEDYILGYRNGKMKDCMEATKFFREKYHLEDHYSNCENEETDDNEGLAS